MYVIGLAGDCRHSSAACLFIDGHLRYAEQEERLSRIKHDGAPPWLVLEKILKLINQNPCKKIVIAACGISLSKKILMLNELSWHRAASDLVAEWKNWETFVSHVIKQLRPSDVFRYEHHDCHAACAHASVQQEDAVIIVADGQGDFVTTSVYLSHDGQIDRVQKLGRENGSFGFLFAAVTKKLGYKPFDEEGKVSAYGAYGNFSQSTWDLLDNSIVFDNGFIRFNQSAVFDVNRDSTLDGPWIDLLFSLAKSEDVVFTLQELIAVRISAMAIYWMGNDYKNLALGGGLFANVSITRRIRELVKRNVAVQTFCGDEGTCIGAGVLAYRELSGKKIDLIHNNFLGSHIGLQHYLHLEKKSLTTCEIAERLSIGEIMIRAVGPGEFGPRALGNRSIIFRPTVKNINHVNKILGRDKLMPFCPLVLEEDANLWIHRENHATSGYTMETSFLCTKSGKKRMGLGVYVDGTARVQVVRKMDGFIWQLMSICRGIGVDCLLNTSLNKHGYPIVNDMADVMDLGVELGASVVFIDDGLILL